MSFSEFGVSVVGKEEMVESKLVTKAREVCNEDIVSRRSWSGIGRRKLTKDVFGYRTDRGCWNLDVGRLPALVIDHSTVSRIGPQLQSLGTLL